jgi:branched-chain amino acid transport system ATP-binding protein
MNLTYAEQRALEIGITIAGGANVILLDEPTAGMSREETAALHRADQGSDGGQDAADGGARHGRGVRPGRQDRGGGVRRGDRLRHAGAVRANQKVQEAYLGSSVADQQAGGH